MRAQLKAARAARQRCNPGPDRHGRTAMSNAICSIEGCDRSVSARGWCGMHYQRWQRNGDPRARVLAATPGDSFEMHVADDGDCTVWTGGKYVNGYGRISFGGKSIRAHRYAWEREHGPIPEGMVIDHTCWNRACVNVDHLRLATHSQNCSNLRGSNADNRSTGVRNVTKVDHRYRVAIKTGGVKQYFGSYSTVEEAASVAQQKRAELFGEFAGKGGLE